MRGATTLREGGGVPSLPDGYSFVTLNGVYVTLNGAYVILRTS